jgi:hypothetical protein
MEKDFDGWNGKKKATHWEEPRLYTVGEIWWCRLGVNVNGGEKMRRSGGAKTHQLA